MNEIILICFASFYLLIGVHFLGIWLEFFNRDPNLSPSDRLISLAVLAIATLFWLIVVPLAYLELLQAKRIQKSRGRPSSTGG